MGDILFGMINLFAFTGIFALVLCVGTVVFETAYSHSRIFRGWFNSFIGMDDETDERQ